MKILYGIAGEGLGHAIRCKPILEHLIKKHNVIILCGGRAYEFYKKKMPNITREIGAFRLAFNSNRIEVGKTIFNNLFSLPDTIRKSFKIKGIIEDFRPDVIISDFEPFSAYFAILYKIPSIAIDNQNIAINTEIDTKSKLNRFFSYFVIKSLSPKSNYFLITSFFYPKIKKNNTFLFSPILREEILGKTGKKGKHVLLYLHNIKDSIINSLNKIDEKFILYGDNLYWKSKNVLSKKFNEVSFIKDFINCKAIICNGGFTTLSEAIYLRKPIICIPIGGHHEQILNAEYVEKLGYGIYVKKIDENIINNYK